MQYEVKKEKRMDAEKKQNEKAQKEEQAHQSKNDAIIEVQLYEDKVDRAQSSADALHIAIEGLKTLRETMMQAAILWERMQEYCKALSENNLKDTVGKKCVTTVSNRG